MTGDALGVGVVFKRYKWEICRATAKSGRYWPTCGTQAGWEYVW